MSDVAIRADGLGKQHRIGKQERYKTLRDTLAEAALRSGQVFRRLIRRGQEPDGERTIWALKDVSFEVKPGEVLGIIGRNGAGKTTLLKILSRVTDPTEGCAEIHGRVGSLLEVGTGFHPELTGRENIYLNGAILGMKRAEIARKFDEIVTFSEVEKFLDTPVKHYSSGMYLRLAFAVAAHLEPEILLVDEVLAVGDAQFQDRCLRRMGTIAGGGRTVLFVSHNMNAVGMLCKTAMLLDEGRIRAYGPATGTVSAYLGTGACGAGNGVIEFADDERSSGTAVRLRSVSLEDETGKPRAVFKSSERIAVLLEFDIDHPAGNLCVGFDLCQLTGSGAAPVLRTYHNDGGLTSWPSIRRGRNRLQCTVPPGLLNAGTFSISPRIGNHCQEWLVKIESVIAFRVALDHGISPYWVALNGRNRPGVIAPILHWQAV